MVLEISDKYVGVPLLATAQKDLNTTNGLPTNDHNSNTSLSSSFDEENMEIMEVIRNILEKTTPFANENQVTSAPKKVSSPRLSETRNLYSKVLDNLAILYRLNSCQQLLQTFVLIDNVSPILQSLNTIPDKDPHNADIPILKLHVDFSNFASHDDFILVRTRKNNKKQLQVERTILAKCSTKACAK